GPGDTIFLGMCRRPGATTVTSVTDSIGSTYTDLGVDKQMNNTSSSAWFGHVNEGSADPVTVTISFSGAGADGLDVRAVEYARVASIGPHAQNSSNSAYGITVGVHLDSVPALAVVSTCVASATLAIGGFEEESRTSNGNVTGSQLFTTVQDVSVEPTQSSKSDMIVDLVTLVGTQ
ncbi:MAG TPA: hypothetical protein VGC41_08505, partial [Kofleriaceae bacterium]